MRIWAEWVCKRCLSLHRVAFDITSNIHSPQQRKGILFMKDEIWIQDSTSNTKGKSSVRGGSKIYCLYNTPIQKLLDVLRTYMNNHYAIKDDTLTLEVCEN